MHGEARRFMNDETERALNAYLISLIQAGSHEAFERLLGAGHPNCCVIPAASWAARKLPAMSSRKPGWQRCVASSVSTTPRDFPHGSTASRTGNASTEFASINGSGD